MPLLFNFEPHPTGILTLYTRTLPCKWWCPLILVEKAMVQMGKMYLLRSPAQFGGSPLRNRTSRRRTRARAIFWHRTCAGQSRHTDRHFGMQGTLKRWKVGSDMWQRLKIMYQNGTFVNGTKHSNLRNPGSLILSHTHVVFF